MSERIFVFSDLYNRVSKFLGTYGSTGPSGTDLADAKEIVNDAYSRFLGARDWTFLTQEDQIITDTNTWVYELPDDFGALAGAINYDKDDSYLPLEERPIEWIRKQRSLVEYSQFPEYYAIRSVYNKDFGTKWEIMFYPTPDAAYSLWYLYKISPVKLEDDNDLPIGGSEYSGLIKQLCLAEAESSMDETSGVQEAKAGVLLADAIKKDVRLRPHKLGYFGNGERVSSYDIARGSILTSEISPYSDGVE